MQVIGLPWAGLAAQPVGPAGRTAPNADVLASVIDATVALRAQGRSRPAPGEAPLPAALCSAGLNQVLRAGGPR